MTNTLSLVNVQGHCTLRQCALSCLNAVYCAFTGDVMFAAVVMELLGGLFLQNVSSFLTVRLHLIRIISLHGLALFVVL